MSTRYSFILIKVRNPFDLADKEVKHIKVRKPIKQFIDEYLEDDIEVWVTPQYGQFRQESINYVPADGDYVTVTPVIAKGDKGILGIIAGIALSVVTMGVGSALSGGAFLGKGVLAISSWTFGATVAAIGVMALGGNLISHMMPKPKVDIPEFEQNQAYGWSPQSSQGEGIAIPMTYGSFVTSGHLLTNHVTTDPDNNEKQYLNLLLCGGEGPIDNIGNIKINNNPISNFKDVVIETRYGTNDQTPLSNFMDTYNNKSLSYKLSTDTWSTDQTISDIANAIEIAVEFPQGLCYMNDNGSYGSASVVIEAQYRKLANNEGWKTFQGSTFSVSEAKSTAFRKVYKQDNLQPGRYEVAVKLRSVSGTSNRYINSCYWSTLTDILYDDLTRPNKVLLSIKALANDQLNGSLPNVTWEQTRNNVLVWNPTVNQYQHKPANNPAWAAYDILHYCRHLKNINTGQYEFLVHGIQKEYLDYYKFEEWAEFCQSKGLQYNAILSSAQTLWDAIRPVATCGRGRIVQKGAKFSCIFDAPTEPVQLFNMSNIIANSFKEQFIETHNRANAIEVSYYDKTKDYQKLTFLVKGDGWDQSDIVDNPTQITLDGCTSREQAYKEALFRLNVNKYLVRSIDFEADADAIACQVGDVILVQHDVPKWGGNGSRIKAINGHEIILMSEFEFDKSKSYTMIVRYSDDTLEHRAVYPVSDNSEEIINTDTVTALTQFSRTPQMDDLCVVSVKEPKPFRITGIQRIPDTSRAKIGALEYIEAVYSDAINIPVYNYSDIDTSPVEVENLICQEVTYLQKDKTSRSDIECVWMLPAKKYVDKVAVYVCENDGAWRYVTTTPNTRVTIDNVKTGSAYKVRVTTFRGTTESAGVISELVEITGKDKPPLKPTGLKCQEVNGGILLSWNPPTERDVEVHNVYQGMNGASLQGSQLVSSKHAGTSIFVPIMQTGQYVFHIQAVDYSDLVSEPATIEFGFALPPDVQGFDVTPISSDLDFRWQALSGNCIVEIRRGSAWDVASEVIGTSNTSYLRKLFPIPGEHKFWAKAKDQWGNYSANATEAKITLLGDNDRNAVLTIDQVKRQWTGTKINVHVSDGGLQLDNNVWRGEHLVEVELPKSFAARNWINSNMIGVSSDQITWGDAIFQWDSPEAQAPWKPDGDITGAKLTTQISTYTGVPNDVIESFPLNGSGSGDRNATMATENKDVTYTEGRFRKGAFINDTSRLSWNVTIPETFHTVFHIKVDQPILDDVVYMTFKSAQVWMMVGYDKAKKVFYIQDHLGRRNEANLNIRSKDFIKIGIAQNSIKRKLFAESFATNTVVSSEQDYGPVGIFTAVFCYPKII